jgi:hypothetical protein
MCWLTSLEFLRLAYPCFRWSPFVTCKDWKKTKEACIHDSKQLRTKEEVIVLSSTHTTQLLFCPICLYLEQNFTDRKTPTFCRLLQTHCQGQSHSCDCNTVAASFSCSFYTGLIHFGLEQSFWVASIMNMLIKRLDFLLLNWPLLLVNRCRNDKIIH